MCDYSTRLTYGSVPLYVFSFLYVKANVRLCTSLCFLFLYVKAGFNLSSVSTTQRKTRGILLEATNLQMGVKLVLESILIPNLFCPDKSVNFPPFSTQLECVQEVKQLKEKVRLTGMAVAAGGRMQRG